MLPSDTGAWDQSNPINTYRLQESIGKVPNVSTPNITIAGSALSIDRSNLIKGQQYYYRLFASNNAGESASTPIISEMAIERPTVPLNLTIDWNGPMSLFLQWTIPINRGNGPNHPFPRALIAFVMDIDKTSDAFANVFRTVAFSRTAIDYTISAPDLIQGTKYYFRVKTNNSAGFSPYSNKVGKTAIALPTALRNLVAAVTSPLEITLGWQLPINTGGVGQTWSLLNYTVYMATNETHLGEKLILKSSVHNHVQIALTKAVRYYFRVFAINEAGVGPASNSATEEGVTLPTMPSVFTLATADELQLLLSWQLPSDTGTGGQNRGLLRYILEWDDVLTSNGSFTASPYSLDPNTTCYSKASPPCNPSQNDPMMVSGVDTRNSRLFSSLQWGNTYFFRIFAVNSAGMGKSTLILNEQALVRPSAPLNVFNNLMSANGLPIFVLTWDVPLETGAGNIKRFQDPTGAVTGNARKIDNYRSQAAPVSPGETSISADYNDPANTVAIDPATTATMSGLQKGFVYFFRVAAENKVGRGPWSTVTTSGPEVDRFVPHSGQAAGGFEITVYGQRFGTSQQNIMMKVGETYCPTIKLVKDDLIFICVAPPGTGGTKDVVVSIVSIPVKKDRQFIYEAPIIISGIIPPHISSKPNQLITVVGKNFGVIDMTPTGYIQGKVLVACSSNTWIADTSIHCVTPEVSEGAVERNTVQIVVDSIRNTIFVDAPYFNYTDLPAFYFQCLSQPSDDCFDCVVSSCYELETSKAMSTGATNARDALEICEATAAEFCRLDEPV